MGSVLRLAGNIGAAKVIFIKDEEYPEARNWKIKKTASGADKKVQWEFCKSHELFDRIPVGYVLTALETTPSATNLFETELPQKMAVVIGNEVHGIEETLLKKAEKTVFIPVPGVISSLNVTHALSVILFEWLRTNLSGLH
jgi:tRNA G18 (ribose-2'-O)-methylase SpoU